MSWVGASSLFYNDENEVALDREEISKRDVVSTGGGGGRRIHEIPPDDYGDLMYTSVRLFVCLFLRIHMGGQSDEIIHHMLAADVVDDY